jgi:hypothetical protein
MHALREPQRKPGIVTSISSDNFLQPTGHTHSEGNSELEFLKYHANCKFALASIRPSLQKE